jgi:hypothetical protein
VTDGHRNIERARDPHQVGEQPSRHAERSYVQELIWGDRR